MPFFETLLSFLKKAQKPAPVSDRPKIYDQVEVAFWKSNVYRAENADLDELSPSSIQVVSYWNLNRGTQIELNLTLPAAFPSESHSLRINGVVVKCKKPRGRRRYRIECRLKDLDMTAAQKIQEFKDWALKQP